MKRDGKVLRLKGEDPNYVLTKMEKGNVPTLTDLDVVFFNPQESKLAVQCCDCGLVHHFTFVSAKETEIGFKVTRDNYTTVKYRLNNGIFIKHKEKINFFRRLFWKSKIIIMGFLHQTTTKTKKTLEK